MNADQATPRKRRAGLVVAVWLWVAVPFAYGVYGLSTKVAQLFHG